jgi:Fur family ferric uptake transcriptional regulator
MADAFSSDLRESLRRVGLRVTPQRMLVLEILERGTHLDAMAIHERAARAHRGLSLATVYRALAALTEAGLVEQRYLDSDHTREYYEAVRGPEHHHMTCLGCGEVIEFETRRIRQLRSELEGEKGWTLQRTCLCIEGYCPNCQAEGRIIPIAGGATSVN